MVISLLTQSAPERTSTWSCKYLRGWKDTLSIAKSVLRSHFQSHEVTATEDATLAEVEEIYKEYDPAIRRVISMIEHPMKRWPLLLTVCPTWSPKQKNLVLIGDAAHSMTNHMAQGAATSMEDGAFLGIVLGLVAHGKLELKDAIDLYEKERMPLADVKQQISFLNGLIYHAEDNSEGQRQRDEAMKQELNGDYLVKSPNLYADPWTWRTIYGRFMLKRLTRWISSCS